MPLSKDPFHAHSDNRDRAANPDYFQAFKAIAEELENDSKSLIMELIQTCNEWEKAVEVNLLIGLRVWKSLAELTLSPEQTKSLEPLLDMARQMVAAIVLDRLFASSEAAIPSSMSGSTSLPKPDSSPFSAVEESELATIAKTETPAADSHTERLNTLTDERTTGTYDEVSLSMLSSEQHSLNVGLDLDNPVVTNDSSLEPEGTEQLSKLDAEVAFEPNQVEVINLQENLEVSMIIPNAVSPAPETIKNLDESYLPERSLANESSLQPATLDSQGVVPTPPAQPTSELDSDLREAPNRSRETARIVSNAAPANGRGSGRLDNGVFFML